MINEEAKKVLRELIVTPEEKEIYNYTKIYLNSKKALKQTYINQLKKYDLNKLEDKTKKDLIEIIEEDEKENNDNYSHTDISIDIFYMMLNRKLEYMEEFINNSFNQYMETLKQETNIVFTEELEAEAKKYFDIEAEKYFKELLQDKE